MVRNNYHPHMRLLGNEDILSLREVGRMFDGMMTRATRQYPSPKVEVASRRNDWVEKDIRPAMPEHMQLQNGRVKRKIRFISSVSCGATLTR